MSLDIRQSTLCIMAAVFVFPAVQLHALPRETCQSTPAPPKDLALKLETKDDQAVFRQGEIITLRVRYEARVRGKYLLNNRSYDRSGRLDGMEIFCIDPAVGIDPLRDYFNSAEAFIGGGLSSEEGLGPAPHDIDIDLNEWQTLPPGDYRVSVIGSRVSLGIEGDFHSWNNKPIPLSSNEVEFRVIVADKGWQAAQLADVVRVLDSSSAESEKRHAARVLRFLGSEDAVQELVRRFWSGDQNLDWDFEAGLFGSPCRATVIDEMRGMIKAQPTGVRREFADALVTLELQSDPHFRPPQRASKDYERAFDAYRAEHDRRMAVYMASAATEPRFP